MSPKTPITVENLVTLPEPFHEQFDDTVLPMDTTPDTRTRAPQMRVCVDVPTNWARKLVTQHTCRLDTRADLDALIDGSVTTTVQKNMIEDHHKKTHTQPSGT